MKTVRKRLFFLIALLLIFLIFIYKKWPDKSTKVVFCDVGQGDSILIQQGFFQLIIDSGASDRLLGCLGHVLPFWDQTIEVVIISHFDSDHMAYFGEIMGIYNVKEIYFIEPTKNNQLVKDLLAQINNYRSGLVSKQPVLGQSIVLPSGDNLSFLEVVSLTATELTENDRSLGGLLNLAGTQWLFTGDGELSWEEALLERNYLPQVDVLKVGHHGSNTSSSSEFLEKVLPDTAVISVGKNSFGHPHPETLAKLESLGVKIFSTEQSGDIIFKISDGKILLAELRKRF